MSTISAIMFGTLKSIEHEDTTNDKTTNDTQSEDTTKEKN